jgi:hypothetical protein
LRAEGAEPVRFTRQRGLRKNEPRDPLRNLFDSRLDEELQFTGEGLPLARAAIGNPPGLTVG